MTERYVGIDVGAETLKVVELVREDGTLRWGRRHIEEHEKEPGPHLLAVLERWDWGSVGGAAASGRLSRTVTLPRIPTKQAQLRAHRHLHGDAPGTIVSIGSHGFSVLEIRDKGLDTFRENSRCAQGTGNFLRQLVERFRMTIDEASLVSEGVDAPAALSGRCPVILKTDMTHLANKGESRPNILAGLYDAVAENVAVLVKPSSPSPVALIGGVTRSRRIRQNLRAAFARHNLALEGYDEQAALFYEAIGCALIAAEGGARPPALRDLLAAGSNGHLEHAGPLREALSRVRRLPAAAYPPPGNGIGPVVLGLDLGSTGSKAVALDAVSREPLWESYVPTEGNPVGAAQTLVRRFLEHGPGSKPVLLVGTTGSGREIVGSLVATCFGPDSVFVLNEIAALAEGALHHDPRVDTIFEIGGQDAKYIRLTGGRVTDAAMNEACSAGTGSFIEEQGRRFSGIESVVQLGREALEADACVSLGQHCSVFMAEIVDEGAAAGESRDALIAGLYDSVIQNYLNRVKGTRSVGQVVFCQGMPFAADALAAAVARQTGSDVVVPPNPGTVGALGIALLALKRRPLEGREPLDLARLLEARVASKDTFVCRSVQGCGGAGNKCRIERLTTRVAGEARRFTWGGGCSLHDKGTGRLKLPDGAPDPFREREELLSEIASRLTVPRGRPRVGVTDEFVLKGLFPFFATYLVELGFDLVLETGADRAALKRGIEESNVPFCAPMQLYKGLASRLADAGADKVFLPMIRSLPRACGEPHAAVCPLAQASADLVSWDLGDRRRAAVVSTVIDVGVEGLRSAEFLESCRRVARELGARHTDWRRAHARAIGVQEEFDARCLELGRTALAYCAERGIVPIVVLGRAYTIYNRLLNSNVPAILREQGTIAVPVDCYPVEDGVPAFDDIYWGYGQRLLRAAEQIRETPGIYSLFCSNYSCGPDSFNMHFYGFVMEGKPFAIIETDGHSGDAGTKTRVEAFLHCVREHLDEGLSRQARSLASVARRTRTAAEILERGEVVLVPQMGPTTPALVACLRGRGFRVEMLAATDRETVRIGRRHTSGKECVPMCITAGNLLRRLDRERDTDTRFTLVMPKANGPCRFGVYHLLHKLILDRSGFGERVGTWSPSDEAYFEGLGPAFPVVACAAITASDLLTEALHDVSPVETRPGAAKVLWERYREELFPLIERASRRSDALTPALFEAVTGGMFGFTDLLRRAAAEFAAIKGDRDLPTVAVVGEIFVRLDDGTNDSIVEKLEARGFRVRLAPGGEWLEYTKFLQARCNPEATFGHRLSYHVQRRIQNRARAAIAPRLGWPSAVTVEETLEAAERYLRADLQGEAVLTVGGPVAAWRRGEIDGVVSVGPLECMPNKIGEAQLFHVAQREGLPSLTLGLNGDPIDPEILENFAYEVHERFAAKGGGLQPNATRFGPDSTDGKTATRRSHPSRTRPRLESMT